MSSRKTTSQHKIKFEEDAGPSLKTRDLPRRHLATTKQEGKGDEDDTSLQHRNFPALPMSSTHKSISGSKQKMRANEEGSSSQDHDLSWKRGKACHVCRRKKVKCDGVRPICGYCIQRNLDCDFDDPATWGKERQLAFQVKQLTAQLAAARQEVSILRQALGHQQQTRQNDPGPANRSYAHLPISRLTLDDSGQQHTGTGYDVDPSLSAYYQDSVVLSSPSSFQGYSDSPSADEADSYSGYSGSSKSTNPSFNQAGRR